MVRKMCIVLVLLLMLRSLELLHMRWMVMRTWRLLLAVMTVKLHVMVKTGAAAAMGSGMGMVLFLEILLLLMVNVLRVLLMVVVLGCHLLHVSLRDLGSLLLLLLIRCGVLCVWRYNVIRLLVGAVVSYQLQIRQNVSDVVVGASRNICVASVVLLLLLLVFHLYHVGVPNFLVPHKLLIVHAHNLLLLLRVMLLGRLLLLLRFLFHLLLSLLVMSMFMLDVLRVNLLLLLLVLMMVMRRLMLLLLLL